VHFCQCRNRSSMKSAFILFLFILPITAYTQSLKAEKLCNAAVELTQQKVVYNPAYVNIPYPNGDVPSNTGVCTDVIIRAYRKLGIDLQKEVHEDMANHFNLYPKDWGAKQPDKNIDHRRVPNLMTFFTRKGKALPPTQSPADYMPGDIVTWDLGGGITHIGIIINRKNAEGSHYLIVHKIGNGQEISDCLFKFKIIGHYRYGV